MALWKPLPCALCLCCALLSSAAASPPNDAVAMLQQRLQRPGQPTARAAAAAPAPGPPPGRAPPPLEPDQLRPPGEVDQARLSDEGIMSLAGNFSDSVRAGGPTLHHRAARGAGPPGGPVRRVYIDMGANWANTLRLYQDIGERGAEVPWEVYAFEASPYIQPYLEAFVGFLNGRGTRPNVTVPPTGSSRHLSKIAGRYGCPKDTSDRMRKCMFKVFHKELSKLRPDPALKSADLVKERLETATRPAVKASRFVAVPAAVGAEDGELSMGMMTPEQMIRGGAISGAVRGAPMVTVPLVDVVSWMARSFRQEDYVVVKMDVEGAEFSILGELLKGKLACLMDVLAMECHRPRGNCTAVDAQLKKHPCIKVEPYDEWDHFSAPDVYYPIDPRK